MARILSAVNDLMFRSRIEEVGRSLGTEIQTVRTSEELLTSARNAEVRLILIDLDNASLASTKILTALCRESRVPVIGYLSHVNKEVEVQARAAGCSQVLSRGKFTKKLPELLQ